MGSVIQDVECPRCGNPEAYSECYYKRGFEYVMCFDCGYYRETGMKKPKKTYGVFKVQHKGGIAEIENLSKPITRKYVKEFIEYLGKKHTNSKGEKVEIDIDRSYLHKWNSRTSKITCFDLKTGVEKEFKRESITEVSNDIP
jgi:uncharacterized Zn finger protein